METLQNLLTIAIEVVAIAGFGGIALHAIWSDHCKWMAKYCPTIEPVVVEPVAVEPAAVEPPVVEPVAVEPVAIEPAAVEDTQEPLKLTFEDIDNNYRLPVLQSLCDQHGITWKNTRGKGKHMLKGAMIQKLITVGVF